MVFRGQILKFNIEKDYDIIFINDEILKKDSFYQVSTDYEIKNIADNKSILTFKKNLKLIVKFIKQINIKNNLGILKFREFDGIISRQNKSIHFEIYNVISPFSLEQYYDGSFMILELFDVKIKYNISCNVYIKKLKENKYKIPYVNDLCILIYSDDFNFRYKPIFQPKYSFNILKYNEITQINIYLNKTKEEKNLILNSEYENTIFSYKNKKITIKNLSETLIIIDGIIIYNMNGNNYKKEIEGKDFIVENNSISYDDFKIII